MAKTRTRYKTFYQSHLLASTPGFAFHELLVPKNKRSFDTVFMTNRLFAYFCLVKGRQRRPYQRLWLEDVANQARTQGARVSRSQKGNIRLNLCRRSPMDKTGSTNVASQKEVKP